MEQNTVGELLSYYRRKYKLKQEDICEGICSVATLSRLEKGKRDADSLVCEMLLSRNVTAKYATVQVFSGNMAETFLAAYIAKPLRHML